MSSADPGWQFAILCVLMMVMPLLVPAACKAVVLWVIEVVWDWFSGPIEKDKG